MYDSEEELFCRCTIVCLDSFDIAEYPINVVSEQNSEYFYEFKPFELNSELLLKLGFEIEFKWSDEILYKKGKYAFDGKYDANLVSKQPGVAAIMKSLGINQNHVL